MSWTKCYCIGTGSVDPFKNASREAAEFIKSQEGFLGVHIIPDKRILWVFDTLNNAKRAKNNIESKGIHCGKGIGEIEVDLE